MKDRTGEDIDPPEHNPDTCPQHWESPTGDPVFCIICRPHLADDKRRFNAGLIDYPPAGDAP